MADSIVDAIRRGAAELCDFVVDTRRDIHAHPELGNQETRTPRLIVDALSGLDLEIRQGVGGTGVMATLRGTRSGPTLALRADMDALPLQEDDPRPYRSCVPGVMHACGHDGHVAMLLGAAHLLHRLREQVNGNIKFLFQPAEETYGGASEMIADGCLSNEPKVDAVFGLHLEPDGDVGELRLRSGPTMASSDVVRIAVQGVGGHASEPHACVDPVPIAAQIITNLQTMVTRRFDARSPVVVTITYLQAGSAFNVIPPEVILAGTVRTVDPKVRAHVPQCITDVAEHTAGAFGAKAEVVYLHGSGVVVNDSAFTQFVTDTITRHRGSAAVRQIAAPIMGAEDFGLYLEQVPGTFAFLGARPSHQKAYPCHHPRFDIDETALPVGVEILTTVALEYLRDGNRQG
ncbi:MAG: amidohydrolase [Deltaproteobacteria bacterium]|nr:amidohydrolase [Deltaproteobacteria bacterium]